jgi:hypothetical protein
VALGALRQEQRERGLDSSGLTKLLTAQKDNVIEAIPSDLAKYLGNTGILDAVTDERSVSASRPQTSRPEPARAPSASSSVIPWILGSLALLGLVLLWRWFAPGPEATVESKAPAPVQTTPPAAADKAPAEAEAGKVPIEMTYNDLLAMLSGVKVGDVDVGDLANGAVNGLRASLEGISDTTSAETGLAGITKAQSDVDQLDGLTGQLTPEKRKILADLFVSVRPSLEQFFDKALAIPGVAAIIRPAVDAIRTKLDALAKV